MSTSRRPAPPPPSRGRPRLPLPSALAGPARHRERAEVDLVHPRRALHRGKGLADAVVNCALYCRGSRRGGQLPLETALTSARALEDGFVWIGLHEPDSDSLQRVADEFGLHPLPVEDALHAHQRPKLEVYGDTLFLVLKTVHYLTDEELIETGELMLFVGPDFVVTVRHGSAGALQGVRADLEARPDLLAIGPAAVLYAVVDSVVDGYAPAAAALEEDVDEVENQVFSADSAQPTERIYKLKREVMEFRRAVEPLEPATTELAAGSVPGVDPRIADFFRDVHDHVVRAHEQVSSMNELLDSALSSNLAQVTMRQNADMRRISAYVAIAAVCTLVAGVYGMNFRQMPELSWAFGYPFALALMVGFSLLLYRGFKRNGWL